MRSQDPSAAWLRFLAAEAAGRESEAEAALADLFAASPMPAPAPGFADRVMARIATRSAFVRPLVRFGLAAALLLAALSAALLAPMVPPIVGLVRLADLVDGGLSLVVALTVQVAAGLSLWESVGGVVVTVARALLRPVALPFVLAQFAVAGLALRGLVRLASWRRSLPHATYR